VVKWKCGVNKEGIFCWFTTPDPGSTHDLTIFREGELLSLLPPRERVLADKAYVGEPRVITPYKGKILTEVQEAFNSKVNRERIVVEQSFGRLKDFSCLQSRWRHGVSKLNKAFVVCLHLTNMKMKQ